MLLQHADRAGQRAARGAHAAHPRAHPRYGATLLALAATSSLPVGRSPSYFCASSGVIFSLNDKSSSSNLKIDALACLHVIMVTHPAHAFHAHVPALVPPVVACVGDPFYKITSEALLVTQQLVKVGDLPPTFPRPPPELSASFTLFTSPPTLPPPGDPTP